LRARSCQTLMEVLDRLHEDIELSVFLRQGTRDGVPPAVPQRLRAA
jgi:hypothetical protein